MAGPLAGIKVVDLSAIISGPMCCQILADQGADVIKVEPREIGDLTRIGAFRVGSISAMYASVNRGKRSICLDLSQDEGVGVLKRLVADADVVVQNFRPGAVERMGIGPDDLQAVNPRLIYVSISGFGPSGPYRDWRVYDPIIQSIAGLPSIQVHNEVQLPDLVRTLVCDKSTATLAAQAITAALFARERGQATGQHLTVPMLDSALYWSWPDVFMGHSFEGPDVVGGPTISTIYRLQQTADGHLVYFAASNAEAFGLFRALGHPEWAEDDRFSTPVARQTGGNFEALGALIHAAFLEFPTEDILARLQSEQVPSAPVNSLDDVFVDPQVVNNGVIHEWELAGVGTARQARPPVRWSHTQDDTKWTVDALGESTEAVLREHGYADEALASLRAAGIIGAPAPVAPAP
jgi:crotonobetainyl-CoA:carnitine CoA-transferase CaiB-like acyl-CoA transferase